MTNKEFTNIVRYLVLANLSIQRTSLSARRRAARSYTMNTNLQLEANLLDAQIAALDEYELSFLETCSISEGEK